MAGVLEVLSQAVSIPVDELKLRSSGTDAEVDARLRELADKGLVEIRQAKLRGLSSSLGDVAIAGLTSKGLKATIR